MADDLSPLVNLDLINKIYKTINAQINERVYDPRYNTAATLGDVNHRYVNAYLKALNVNGDATITGNVTSIKNIAATTFNNLTLESKTSGFKISGGASKALTIADTTSISKPLTVEAATSISAATTISAELTVSAATNITKSLTVNAATTIGTTSTGAVEIKSGGTEKTTIIGPNNGSVTFTTPTSDLQGAVKIGSASSTSTIGVSASKYLKVYTDTEIGGKTNIGKVSIQPNGANALTINGPSDGKAVTLKSGTCVVEADCDTRSIADKLVKRDTNSNILVGNVNGVKLTSAATGFTAEGGTTPKTLTVSSKATLGSSTASENGSVTIKSAGTSPATIVGPSGETAQFNVKTTIGAASTNTGAVTIQSSGSGATVIQGPSGKTAAFNVATTIGATSDNTGAVEVKSAGANKTIITGPDNGSVAFTTPSSNTQGAVTISDNSTDPKISTIGISAGKSLRAFTSVNVGDPVNYGDVTIKSSGTNPTTIVGPSNKAANFLTKTTIGSTKNTGDVDIQPNGTNKLTINGPKDGVAVSLIGGTYTTSATTSNNTTPTENSLLKIEKISANQVLIGPASGEKDVPTYRILASDDLPTVPCGKGGTGITTYTTGDILYASASNTLSRLGKGSNGQVLKMSNGAPAWGTNDTVTQTIVTTANSYPILASATADAKATTTTTSVFASGITITPSSNTIAAKTFKGDLSGNATSASTITTNGWPEPVENDDGTKTAFIGYVTVVDEAGTEKNVCVSKDSDSGKGVSIERKETTTAEGETVGTYHLYAGAVHNAVWNDLADCIEVPEDTDLEFGYCYSWDGDRVEKTSRKSKNCIGIHSNTAGLFMGEKPVKTIQAAVAGFALAYTDKIYPEGTPLTWSDDGKLTKCTTLKCVLHPERVIATFYKEEKQESWHGVKVNNRHWVKVR